MASNPPTTRHTTRVRSAVKVNHLRAVRRVVAASKRIQARADAVKAEIRRLADVGDPLAARAVQKILTATADDFDRMIYDTVRDSSAETARRIFASLKAIDPQGYKPFAAVSQVGKSDPYEPAGVKFIGPIGILLGLAFVGVMAFRSGNKQGLVAAEIAVDRLATRAKRAVQFNGLAASNGAMISVVESLHGVPVAKRIPVARLIPVAKLIPVAARKYPPFILNLPEPAPAAPPVIPPTVRPSRTTPAPGEPEFIILPDPTGKLHRGYPNEEYVLPGDPVKPVEPRKPIRTLVGWQVLSMLDNRVRPKHAERHGRVYYYHPRPERGERGMDECPNPPFESERDGGVRAWNCRCVLGPVFEDQEM